MYTDTLRETLQEIEAYCAQNDVPLFYGYPEVRSKRLVLWDGEAAQDWKAYLATFRTVGVKILHLSTRKAETPDDEEKEMLLAYGKTLEGTAAQEWQQSYSTLEQTAGFLIDVTLIFFHEGYAYQWTSEMDWEDHYFAVQPPMALRSKGNEADEPGDEEAALEEDKQRAEKEQRISDAADAFLLDEAYLNLQKKMDRTGFVVQSLWGEPAYRDDLHRIAAKAEQRFKETVLDKREKELAEKIKTMRSENPKLSKTAAAGILKLSDREINRYWYSA